MNFTLNEVMSLKLASGEEIITKITAETDTALTLSNPLSIAPGPGGVGLMPTMFTSDQDQTVTLNKSSVVMVASTSSAVASKYIEATTGIATVPKKIIID